MRLALDPSLAILNRSDGSIQLGWDPEHAMLLRPPPNVVDGETLATRLQQLRGLDCEQVAAAIRELGFSPSDTATMMADLDAAGLLEQPERPQRPRSIRVHGRGPLADAVWTGLSRLGRTTSRSRSHSAGVDISAWRHDLVVLTDRLVAEPQLVERLHEVGLRHLQVRIRDGRGIVGPLVIPGETSCLRCADLTRRDHDADWPFLAAQLHGRIGHARPAAVAATAALALDQLDVACSSSPRRSPAILNATLELDLESHRIDKRQWPRHQACDCAQNK